MCLNTVRELWLKYPAESIGVRDMTGSLPASVFLFLKIALQLCWRLWWKSRVGKEASESHRDYELDLNLRYQHMVSSLASSKHGNIHALFQLYDVWELLPAGFAFGLALSLLMHLVAARCTGPEKSPSSHHAHCLSRHLLLIKKHYKNRPRRSSSSCNEFIFHGTFWQALSR